MTIVIGFTCRDALVMVSDSQMSQADRSRMDETKVFPVKFGEHHHAIVGIAGVLGSAGRFIEFLEEKARFAKVTEARSIADIFEDAITETRAQYLRHIENELAGEERERHLEALLFQSMLAYYYDGKPHIYRADFRRSVATLGRHHFEVLGSGRDIANLMLSGCHIETYNAATALGIAYHAVEACKENDMMCGGPFQHLVLRPDANPATPVWQDLLEVYQTASKKIKLTMHRLLVREMGLVAESLARTRGHEMPPIPRYDEEIIVPWRKRKRRKP